MKNVKYPLFLKQSGGVKKMATICKAIVKALFIYTAEIIDIIFCGEQGYPQKVNTCCGKFCLIME